MLCQLIKLQQSIICAECPKIKCLYAEQDNKDFHRILNVQWVSKVIEMYCLNFGPSIHIVLTNIFCLYKLVFLLINKFFWLILSLWNGDNKMERRGVGLRFGTNQKSELDLSGSATFK